MQEKSVKSLHPRDQIILIINRIYKNGLTTTSGGNLSIKDDNGDMWVTPSGVDKGALKPTDIICVKANGEIIGKHKPSMEYPFHSAIYKNRPDLKSVVHAHPPALVAFSIVREIPNTNAIAGTYTTCGMVGYAKYSIPGSDQLGVEIAEQFKHGFNSVIMENHGAVVGGTDIFDAFDRFETLEFCARTSINSNVIGKVNLLTPGQIAERETCNKEILPGSNELICTDKEIEKKEEICEMVKRACEQGLMRSGAGSISVRTEGEDFLITPANYLRWNIQEQDLVKIEKGKVKQDKSPCYTVELHKNIYESHPDINAIIIAQPDYLMAHAVTHRKLDVRTIPESWIFLQDMENVKFSAKYDKDESISSKVGNIMPGVIIENDSVVMTGNSLLQAFDRLEVAEFSARSLVMGTSLGKFAPMGDDEIEELRSTFF